MVAFRDTKRGKINKHDTSGISMYAGIQKDKKRHSQHGKAFISFVNGIFLKSGMARRMLDFNRYSTPTQ